MARQIATDAYEESAVRRYVAAAKEKPYEEQVSFNEGVMCAAFTLGAFIEGSSGLHPDAYAVLERAFKTMTGMKIQIVRKITAQGNEDGN